MNLKMLALSHCRATNFCLYNFQPPVIAISDLSYLLIVSDKELQIGHRPSNAVKDDRVPLVAWEPYFCVLLQDEQTLTAYRSEELSVSLTRSLMVPVVRVLQT